MAVNTIDKLQFLSFIFKTSYGGRPPLRKTLNVITLQPFQPILMKFGMMMHLRPLHLMGNQKLKKNPSWQPS